MSLLVSLMGSVVLLGVALSVPALQVQLGFALCGKEAPGFWRALWAAWMAGVAAFVVGLTYGLTVGWLVALFSTWVSAGLHIVLALFVTAGVYRWWLGARGGTAFKVALIQWMTSFPVAWGLWTLLRWAW